jgi:hypothetical protein
MGRHEPVCSECGQAWPCSAVHDQYKADRVAERLRQRIRRLSTVSAGDCLGCGLPVTSRHRQVVFPGPNLWRPDFGEGALFHARKTYPCRAEADEYDRAWAAAWPGRTLMLTCRSFQTHHQDGTIDCDNPLCPAGGQFLRGRSVVEHSGSMAQCYIVHEVCPRGCSAPPGAAHARKAYGECGAMFGFDASGPRAVSDREPAAVIPLPPDAVADDR